MQISKNRLVFTVFLITCAVLCSTQLYSQIIVSENELIADIQNSEMLNPESALILVAIRSGTFDALAVPEDPQMALETLGFNIPSLISEQIEAGSPLWTSYGVFSFLLTQFFDIPGGIFYTMFPSGHYALKELQFRGLVDVNIFPRHAISGEAALSLLYAVEELIAQGGLR